jgi:16S rRNA (cytosine967-C5)-methyltransferase
VDLRVEPGLSIEEAQKCLKLQGIETERFSKLPRCLRVRKGKPTRSSLHDQGSIFIQESGSQLIPYLLGVRPGDRVLDACAAPGAKATELARWAEPGLVIALELRPRRLKLMAELARRLSCRNLMPLGGDAGALPLRGSFRSILLDAPCSSLGTLARNPDIKWRVQEKDLHDFASRQIRLLTACAEVLEPGGRLVYSTCSTEPEENQKVIRLFLDRHPGFQIASPPDSFPAGARALVNDSNFLITLPERDQMDGYFAAILEKNRS